MTLQRPPSLVSAGSRLSLYSTTSTVRTSRGGSRNTGQRGGGRGVESSHQTLDSVTGSL